MNRIAFRHGPTELLRRPSPCLILHRQSQLNFGMWWNGDAGWFRRIRGQGPSQHSKFDYLDFKDRPDIPKKFPFLHRFILRRQRDQSKTPPLHLTILLIFFSFRLGSEIFSNFSRPAVLFKVFFHLSVHCFLLLQMDGRTKAEY